MRKLLDNYVSDYVVFDFETTGISPARDAIIEISAVAVKNGKEAAVFTTLVNPGRSIPAGASRVNGITDDMVADAPSMDRAMPDFLDFIGDSVLVGHNIHAFDMKFLYRDCRNFCGKLPENDYIDTLLIARKCLPQLAHHKLVNLAEYYGISSAGAHRALNDCRMNYRVFERLKEEPVKSVTNSHSQARARTGRICPRCGCVMKKRSGRYGEFWGCTGYPGCRYTENI